jgi:hypothetical protein
VKRKSSENNENNGRSASSTASPAVKKPTKIPKHQSENEEKPRREVVHAERRKQTPTESVEVAEKAPVSSSSSEMVVIDDPDYYKKLEEQKRKREELLRLKNEKRNQRILDMSNKNKAENVKETRSVEVDEKPSGAFSSRTVIKTNDPLLSTTKKGLIIQNLSANTQDKSLINMCSSINAKDKVNNTRIFC